MAKISYLNGQFLQHDQCFVHIEDRGFQFADGAYEVTLFKNNKLIDGTNHLNRLMRNLEQLNIEHNFTIENLLQIQLQLFKQNNLDTGISYLQITRGSANARLPSCPKNLQPTITANVSVSKNINEQEFANGFRVITHPDIRWLRCDIKTINLLASTLVNQKAKDEGFDDAIFIRNNIVTEATYANVFIVNQQQQILTHPANNHILSGITRNRLIQIAISQGIDVKETQFTFADLLLAKEVFLTSSSLIIRPVYAVNEFFIDSASRNFTIAKILRDRYQDFINSN